MNSVQPGELPKGALLEKYKLDGSYTDCYFVDLPKLVSHTEYIEAFYTTAIFKVERQIDTMGTFYFTPVNKKIFLK
ncbi:hypothetical protein [uncultured Desulfuromonas sp.]|uniref:hypothetical protein n=1 Tax=uncultured Desulfuromonas sp. TaxID=181013 RepID=UPI002AAB19E7|nr:hypothetical protein [uncultured Desulfuromonas sp.]